MATDGAKHDLAMAINDCTVNEAISTLYYADYLKLNITNPKLNTSLLKLLLGKDIENVFGKNMPCKARIYPRSLL